ncbi:DUF1906 domain-containing protein [Streptomyces coffeae]|uniref:DUF1906 domain-containing protein n=1 Tax=Streptomyces coffeae TaxID=621382 RepID=A0ABS1N8G0_9ACTN|nr:DUF1906 domain-containing protein [Streptomyces coffeae]MBL1096357.1 DUF1906 domain-containing protein [Streptomyces coffeae]
MSRRKQSGWAITGWAAGLVTALASITGAAPVSSKAALPAPSETGGFSSAESALPDPRDLGAKVFTGWAFDTCRTPPLSTLRAWHGSRYRALGVYFGGRGRACPSQPHLTASWMRGAAALGWHALPVYVGSQSPCVRNIDKTHVPIGSSPWSQGRAEARDAVARAKALGMKERSALYLDMEAYDQSHTGCAATTLSFIRAWNREVAAQGFFPGFYSSAESGVRHLEQARKDGVDDLPSVMWFARWTTKASLNGEPALAGAAWQPHRRVHQYRGNVDVTYGGRTLRIDRNKVDAPVAIVE